MAQAADAGTRTVGLARDPQALGRRPLTRQSTPGPQHARSMVPVSRRTPAADGTARGALWSGLVAVGFFLLSHPREMFANLTMSLWFLASLSIIVAVVDSRRVSWPVPPWTVVLFLSICSISVLWSVGPPDTVRAVAMYGSIALYASLVVSNTDTAALLRGIVWGALIVAGLTLTVAWVRHTGGQGPASTTEFAGFHGNRNVVSYTLVMGLCAALCYPPRDRRAALRRVGALVTLFGVLFLTGSGTGLISAAALLATSIALAIARRWDLFALLHVRITGFAVAGGLTLLALESLGKVSQLLGKTPDLSGRGPLWSAILTVWSDAPVGGYGFGAVWSYSWFMAHPNEPKELIDEKTGAWLAHGHNAIFDLLPQVGLIGVMALVIVVLVAARWLFVPLRREEYLAARWAALGLLGVMLCGLAEPMIAVPIGWFVIVAAAATAQRLASVRHLV